MAGIVTSKARGAQAGPVLATPQRAGAALCLVALAGVAASCCSPRPPACPRSQGTRFVDPEIVALGREQREAEIDFVKDLLQNSYPHLEEKRRRFGVEVTEEIARHRQAILDAFNRYQYMNAFDRVLLAFHDGHLITKGYGRRFSRTYRPPRDPARPRPSPVRVGVGLSFRLVEGRIVLWRVRPGSSGARAGLRPGDELLMAGNMAALSRLGSSLRWRGWSRLSAGIQYAASRVMVSRPWYPDTPLPRERVVIDRAGRRIHVTLVGARTPPIEERSLSYEALRCGVGHLKVASLAGAREVMWKRLLGLLERARRSARALVLDLRGNRGGSLGLAHRLVAHLVTEAVVSGEYRYLRSEVISQRVPIVRHLAPDPRDPRWTVWRRDRIQPAERPLALPLAVLVDPVCASACETVARAMEAAPGVTLYGESTAGSSGLPVTVELPHSKLQISLPVWQARTAQGRLIEGHGVAPGVRVPLTIADLRAGRDPVLLRAVDALCRGLASPPRPR